MQLISEEMRNAQTEYNSKLKAAAAELSSVRAESEEQSEQLARQLGQSDLALRQLKAELESGSSTQSQAQGDSQQPERQQELEGQVVTLTNDLAALQTQHDSALTERDARQSEHVKKLEQAQGSNAQLQQEVQSLQDQLEAARQQYEQAEGKADRLKSALQKKSTAADEAQTQLETHVSELQQQLQLQSDAAGNSSALETETQVLKDENDELQQGLVDVQADLAESRQQVCFWLHV